MTRKYVTTIEGKPALLTEKPTIESSYFAHLNLIDHMNDYENENAKRDQLQALIENKGEGFDCYHNYNECLLYVFSIIIACRVNGFAFPYRKVLAQVRSWISENSALLIVLKSIKRFRPPMNAEENRAFFLDFDRMKDAPCYSSKRTGYDHHLSYGVLTATFGNFAKLCNENRNPVEGLKEIYPNDVMNTEN